VDKSTCVDIGCDAIATHVGRCNIHHSRWKRAQRPPRPTEVPCVTCGISVPVRARGNLPRFCSAACNPTKRGNSLPPHRGSPCSTPSASGYKRGCRCPGCYAAAAVYMRQFFNAHGGNPHNPVADSTPCTGCTKPIKGTSLVRPRCSGCGSERLRRALPTRVVAARRKIRAATKGSRRTKIVWVSGRCHECGVEFTRPGAVGTGACSRRCSQKANARRRRVVRVGNRSERVDRIALFDRDGWNCQLCGMETEPESHWLSDWHPTQDHIIAVSNGGEHTYENMQCAHRLCNSIKRDLPMELMAV
jgi:hypothetical protein